VRAFKVTTAEDPAQRMSTVVGANRPDGPRYAAVIVPANTTDAEVSLLDEHGTPVPGGTQPLTLRR
jgi:hypothetical protein